MGRVGLQEYAALMASRLARLANVDDVALRHAMSVLLEDLERRGLNPLEFAHVLLEKATDLENDEVVDIALEFAAGHENKTPPSGETAAFRAMTSGKVAVQR